MVWSIWNDRIESAVMVVLGSSGDWIWKALSFRTDTIRYLWSGCGKRLWIMSVGQVVQER